jgi:RNA polymerase sigma factor (sigma-70 family)
MTAPAAQQARMDRAFERVYRRHVGDVYRYALAVLRNNADAEDVTQTTFLNAYRAYARGERPRNAQNWLIAIAHNVCRQRFRQSLRRPEEVEFDDAIGDGGTEEEAPTAEDIQRALGQLAFNQRAALVMRELEGRSYAEIAEILGTSVSAVETLIFRARRALREQLEGSLTCGEAERAISRDIDGRLPRAEKSALRGHLRACAECQRFARSQRAQRRAIRALAAVPVPISLTSLFGGGGAAALGGGVAVKAAAVVVAGTIVSGVGYEGVKRFDAKPSRRAAEVASSPSRVTAKAPDRPVRRALPAAPLPKRHIKATKKKKAKVARKSGAADGRVPRGTAKKAASETAAANVKVKVKAKPPKVRPERSVKAPVRAPKPQAANRANRAKEQKPRGAR